MLRENVIHNVLSAALSTGGDFAEIFVEERTGTSLEMVGGLVDRLQSGLDYGVGLRIFKDLNYIYSYSNHTQEEQLIKFAREAAAALTGEEKETPASLVSREYPPVHSPLRYPASVAKSQKVDLVRHAYQGAREYDDLISQVRVNYLDEDQRVQIANSEGLMVEDRRVRTRTSIVAIATLGTEKQSGQMSPGASMGLEFYDTIDLADYAREAARIATTMVKAEPCPTGRMPVIIANGFGGVIFHEACGHSLEATSVAKGMSEFAGKVGEMVASPLVTAIDDGTMTGEWGSLSVDDEGEPTRRKVLIEKGVLRDYLRDRFNARRMGEEPNGAARRQSYRFAPTSRMSNTYIAAGESSPEAIIAGTERGLYARYMGGGSVMPATGEFNFAVSEAYLIRDGRLDRPVRGATLIGRGGEVLRAINMVGNDLKLGPGMCGSVSGAVPVNVGQPTIRVAELTVGGSKGGAP